MRRAFSVTLLLTMALAWPVAVRAQQSAVPAGCSADTYRGLALEGESLKQIPNPRTGELEDHLVHRGRVNITCNDIHILADEVDLVTQTSVLTATGNVIFVQQGTRIAATRAVFDLKNKTGVFYVTSGTLALQNKPAASATDHKMDKSLFGNIEPDAYFHGDMIEKLGPRTYRLTHGGFTTCVQPTPRWEMTESSAIITINDHATMHNMVLRVKGVPVFYVPVMYYPVHGNQRSTGFLMPTYGSSTIRGFTLSDAFFWAIGRSEDLTFYYDWFSKIGEGYGTDYRYVGDSGSRGNARLYFVSQSQELAADGTTVVVPGGTSYEIVGDMTQTISSHLKFQARANYFSDLATIQELSQNIADFSNVDRYFSFNLSGGWGPYQIAAKTEVHDYFFGTTQATRYGTAPGLSFNYAQTPIGSSHIYVGFGSEFDSIIRQAVVGDPTTNTGLSRIDLSPSIRAPIGNWNFLSINTSASWRFTEWSQSLNAQGVQVATPVSRDLFTFQTSIVGPSFSRIFDTPHSGYADKFMHKIEPSLTVQYVTPFSTFNQIVKLDSVDTVVGGAMSVTYGLTNHLMAKRRQPGGTTVSREILTVALSQSYYTDQNAAAYDQQYQSSSFSAPSNFSPMVLQITGVPTDLISGTTRFEYDMQNHALRSMSAGGTVNLSTLHINTSYTRQFLVPAVPGFNVAAALAHTLGMSASIHAPDSHLTGTWNWNYDFTNAYMLQQGMTGVYNTQCCGIAFQYQTVYLGMLGPLGIQHDRQFNITFTLAGLGTFSNPLGAFGGAK
jgi:lipopolysaccharide assembly outer membrane protein LptD (OstA)